MQKDAKEILHYDIIPDLGLGEIHFGMTKDKILEKYTIEESINLGKSKLVLHTKEQGGGARLYLFNESIILSFTKKENFILRSIELQNQFKGKYLNQITIGSPFIELYKLQKDKIHFDDDLFFIGKGYNFLIELDMDECNERLGYHVSDFILDYDEGKIDTCKIELIAIQKNI